MAYYFGINVGAGAMGGVTEQGTTTSKDVEVVINTNANVPTKNDLIQAIEKIQSYLVTDTKSW